MELWTGLGGNLTQNVGLDSNSESANDIICEATTSNYLKSIPTEQYTNEPHKQVTWSDQYNNINVEPLISHQ